IPNSPKAREVPRGATPFILPFWTLRHLTFLGLSILGPRPFFLGLDAQGVLLEDFALEDPHLDADCSVGGFRARGRVGDVGAERLQRDAALADLLGAGELGAAEAAAARDLAALGAQAHGRGDGFLHRAAQGHALLALAGAVLAHELGVPLGPLDLA